jgi:predicted phosphoribosyltransferase
MAISTRHRSANYRDFFQITDDEVRKLMMQAAPDAMNLRSSSDTGGKIYP